MNNINTHECRAKACCAPIKPEYLMCRRHWAMVPRETQRLVYATYSQFKASGDDFPGLDWYRAVANAVEAVARAEGRDPANMYRRHAEEMAREEAEHGG